MALSPQLLQFKSSGVYRLEFDKSQVSNVTAETIRLVAGHSRKGPYNTPVYCEDTESFILIFGNIDKKLEKKGMFFHRSCLEALKRGPILAMNLADFDSADKADYAAITTDASDPTAAATLADADYEDFHNTDKFMYPSDEEVLATIGGTINSTEALNLVNLGQDNLSIIVRQAQDVKAFEVTAREWYGEGNLPDGVSEFDYISDYMVDVFVFKGKFDAAAMDTDPVYGDYFTSTGLLKDKLNDFADERSVSLLAQYTGSILPGFQDLEGNGLYLEQAINAETRRTGLFCAINEEAVEEGNSNLKGIVDNASDYELLSYKTLAGDRGIDFSATDFVYASTGATFTFTSASDDALDLEVGDYMPTAAGTLARVNRISQAGTAPTIYTVTCSEAPDSGFDPATEVAFKSFHKAAAEYSLFNLDKITISEQTIVDCLTAFSSGGLYSALTDRDVIDLRYIVDTFGSFEGGELLNKNEFTRVAKARKNVSCILNAPTVAEFKKSSNPSFKDALTGKFNTRFIKDGGDLSQNPTGIYALPTIAEGANYGFYYGPGLEVREAGKIKTVVPAAYVSNNYIDKFTNALPWSIVSGPRRGVITGTNVIGAEYPFDKDDRDNLEPFGINPIVFERGVGLNIKGNKTAQQTVKSALSSAHVREVLIFIENGLADILKDYLFEFNTAQTRLEIKTLADAFMEGVLADSGVYAYDNVIDQTNNTNDIIDNNIGILDTFVEPVKGLEIIVHRTTVLNTGDIASGNF